MRFFLKIVLLAALPIGGYWLYKTVDRQDEKDVHQESSHEGQRVSESSAEESHESEGRGTGSQGEVDSTEYIIEALSNIDGVTSRVAKNLVKMGITSKEALMELTEEELRAVKGIGPKRAEKILKLK